MQDQWLELDVEDHGKGLRLRWHGDAASGWSTMRERAALVGGTLEFARPAEGGTLVRLRVPAARGGLNDMTERITVLLADDHALVRRGFRRLLEDDPDIEVVGEASNGEEAVALAACACSRAWS